MDTIVRLQRISLTLIFISVFTLIFSAGCSEIRPKKISILLSLSSRDGYRFGIPAFQREYLSGYRASVGDEFLDTTDPSYG
jgi:hypothetical protein